MKTKPAPGSEQGTIEEVVLINTIIDLLRREVGPAAGLGILIIIQDLIRKEAIDWLQKRAGEQPQNSSR